MDKTQLKILKEIAQLEQVPQGAYNFRVDGQLDARNTTANIDIVSKTDGKPGIDIVIKPGTRGESVHIPVIISQSGLTDVVYNDFYIGEGADVDIVAGCGIHNAGCETSQHDGIHVFHVGKNARVRYVERHYGEGEGTGERILNPRTEVYLEEGASITMEMTQIKGVDSTIRDTVAEVAAGGECIINEKLMTDGRQTAESNVEIILQGAGATGRVISRSVGRGHSVQVFRPCMTGKADCFGPVQCDSILMDEAKIKSIPAIDAQSVDAQLIHEAAIGRIAGDQILKLLTLGLTPEEAEEKILEGFLN